MLLLCDLHIHWVISRVFMVPSVKPLITFLTPLIFSKSASYTKKQPPENTKAEYNFEEKNIKNVENKS